MSDDQLYDRLLDAEGELRAKVAELEAKIAADEKFLYTAHDVEVIVAARMAELPLEGPCHRCRFATPCDCPCHERAER